MAGAAKDLWLISDRISDRIRRFFMEDLRDLSWTKFI